MFPCRGRTTVYSANGDLVVFITGSGQTDEMECSIVLSTAIGAIAESIHEKKLSEQRVMQHFAKVVVVLDSLATGGVVDVLDPMALKHVAKMAEA